METFPEKGMTENKKESRLTLEMKVGYYCILVKRLVKLYQFDCKHLIIFTPNKTHYFTIDKGRRDAYYLMRQWKLCGIRKTMRYSYLLSGTCKAF